MKEGGDSNLVLVLVALALAFVLLTSKPRVPAAVPADAGAAPGPASSGGIDSASVGSVAGAVVCSVAGAPAAASLCAAAGGVLVPKVVGAVSGFFNPADKGVAAWAREELERKLKAETERKTKECVAQGGRPTTMNGYYSGCNLSGPAIVSPGGGRVTWLTPTPDNPTGVPTVQHCEAIAGRVECWDPTVTYKPGGAR